MGHLKATLLAAALASAAPAAAQESDAGAAYRAVGTEPGWSLAIDEQRMRFSGPYGDGAVEEPTPQMIVGYAGEIYPGRRIDVNIVHRQCSDGMSDRRYPDTVELLVDGRRFSGCGWTVEQSPPPEPQPESEGEVLPPPAKPVPSETVDVFSAPVAKPTARAPAATPKPKPAPPPPQAFKPLAGTHWRILSIGGRAVPTAGDYRIDFTAGDVAARFGCNRFRASYALDRDRLTTRALLATRMACSGVAGSLEPKAAAILAAPARLRWTGADRAELAGKAGTMVLRRR